MWAFWLNGIGLSLGMLGTVLWFFFGLPPDVNRQGHGYLLLEGQDEAERRKGQQYDRLSRLGLVLLFGSFLLQFAAVVLTSYNSPVLVPTPPNSGLEFAAFYKALGIAFFLAILFGLYFGWKARHLTVALTAGALLLFMGNLAQFDTFKLPGGIEAKMFAGTKPQSAAPPVGDDTSARLEVTCSKTGVGGSTGVVAVVSKFQRSGVTLRWKSQEAITLERFEPSNGQPTYGGPLPAPAGSYFFYLQRPWGEYTISLRTKEGAAVAFSYQFEGDPEPPPRPWCS